MKNEQYEMTLDDAIKHAREQSIKLAMSCEDKACAYEHRQLADWLSELKARRELESKPHEITAEYEDEIKRFIRMNRSNGNVTIMYACRYIQDLMERK